MDIRYFSQLNSTNQKAKELAKKEIKPWLVIVANKQTGGYGRKGTPWFSPKGGLYFSVILPKLKIEDLETLTILVTFIVAKIIKENFNLEPFIKLPNDIWINGKKVVGVLTENIIKGNEVKHSVIGIGVNTNIEKFPKDLEKIATSLKIELNKEIDNKKILKEILKGVKEQFKAIRE